MSYPAWKAALLAQLTANVPSLHTVAGAEPQSVEGVSLYVLLASTHRAYIAGAEVTAQYRVTARLAVPVGTDLAAAESTLDPYVNAIPAALDADLSLGGASYEPAICQDGAAGWWTVGSVQYRIFDFVISGSERGPLGTL